MVSILFAALEEHTLRRLGSTVWFVKRLARGGAGVALMGVTLQSFQGLCICIAFLWIFAV